MTFAFDRDATRRLPVLLAVLAAFVPFLWALTLAPRMGPMPLIALGFLAGPFALGLWLTMRRPVAVLVALYAGLAPIDFLLASDGISAARLVGMAAVAALLFSIAARGINPQVPRSLLAWLAALAWMIVTLAWSGDPSKTVERLGSTALPIVIMALVALLPCDRKDLWGLLGAIGVVGFGVSLYAVILHPPTLGAAGGRFWLTSGSTRIDPNGLAFSLMAPLAFALAAASSATGSRWLRVAGCVAAPVIIGAILGTESRGGFLAMGAMLVWVAVRARRRIVPLAFLALGAVASILQGGAVERLFSDSSSNAEGAGRLPIWRVGWEAFQQHWAIGNGYGTFTDAYNQAYLLVPHAFHTGWSREAHNIVISCFVELGVFGGCLVFYAWWCQFRQLSTAIAYDERDGWLRLGSEAGILGVFVTALFLDILVLKPAWVLPILIVLIWTVHRSETPAVAKSAEPRADLAVAKIAEPRADLPQLSR